MSIIFFVLGFSLLFAQSNVSKNIKIKDVEEIAREQNPDLFLPKDEFETNAEYKQRVLKQESLLEAFQTELRAKTEARQKERARLTKERNAENERQLQIKIAESLVPAEFSPSSLGSYNAEKNTFPFKINGQHFTVEVPRSEARDFKKQFSSVKVEGYKQLKHDLKTFEYFNMVAIHPITGSRFPFGPTKKLASAPVIASKKSVVPPNLTMKVAFVEPNGNSFLDAEEKGKVKVSISNNGRGSAMGVFVNMKDETGNKHITLESSKIIGEVPVGKTKTAVFSVIASKSVERMENRFTISATESYGFPPDPAQISFETFPFIPPKLAMVDFGVSTPNDGNEIRPQTTTDVQARIQNRGQGPAEDVKFRINLPKGVLFYAGQSAGLFFFILETG